MFVKIILIAFAIFVVDFAAPEARPQFLIPGATAYGAHPAPIVGAYSGYSTYPYPSHTGFQPSEFIAYPGAAVVV